MTVDTTSVLIIGAGPIGLELAVSLKQSGIDYLQVDAGVVGQTMTWYPQQMLFHSNAERLAISGVAIQTADQQKPTREEFLAYLRAVVLQFDLQIRCYEPVTGISRTPDGRFVVQTTRGVIEANVVVIAIGSMHRPRLLGIPGEHLPHVSHYFVEPHRYFRQKLLVVGGKNSAIEAAVRCQRAGADVTISYRRSDFDPERVKFWLLPEIRSMLRDQRVRALPSTTPLEIRERSVVLQGSDGVLEIEADFVLLLTGYEQDSSLMEMAGVTLHGADRVPQFDPETMETNVPDLFIAGTAVAGSPVGRVQIIVENCHVHVERIVAVLKERSSP
jgi:thioredoxin reductase (NADPH)